MVYVVYDIIIDIEFNLMLVGLFGGLVLLFVCVGVYVVMVVVVVVCECEFGVCVVLGVVF